MACPASLSAQIEDEPLAPAGFDVSALPADVAAWWFGEFIPWARANALRVELGQRWCAAQR